MEMMNKGFSFVLYVFEIGLCYQFLFWCWTEKRALTTVEKTVLSGTVVILGGVITVLGGNAVFSMTTFLLRILVVCVTLFLIPERGRIAGCEVVGVYFTLTALMDSFFSLFVTQYITNEFETYKVTIYICSRMFMVCIYLMMKRTKLDVKKTLSGYGKVLAVMWAGMLVVLRVYLIILEAPQKDMNAVILLLMIVLLFFFALSLLLKNANILGVIDALVLRDDMLAENYRQLARVMDESRETLHDMKHHLQILEEYAQEEHAVKVQQYLQEIGTPVLALEKKKWTESRILNLILNQKAEEAEKHDVEVNFLVCSGCRLPLGDHEISSLFCNLLDNALEACEKVEAGKRWIHLSVEQRKQITFIRISNSADHPQKEKAGRFRSTKGSGHGLGIQSVKRIVEHHDGCIEFEVADSQFAVHIAFFKID